MGDASTLSSSADGAAANKQDTAVSTSGVPRHIAVIMDGNGRWARKRLFPRVEGHRAGAKTVRMMVEECRRLGIRYLTLFSFSTENWLRPREEVSALMKLFVQYLENEQQLLLKHGIRLRAIGELDRLPETVRQSLQNCINATAHGKEMDLILALSYGGRDEIVSATKNIVKLALAGEITPDQINAELVAKYLYAPDVPDPDVLIRTSDENRISNFLLWQLAYTEIVVTKRLWPEFSKEDFQRCLEEYAGRRRRFGMTDEQIDLAAKDSV